MEICYFRFFFVLFFLFAEFLGKEMHLKNCGNFDFVKSWIALSSVSIALLSSLM